MHNNRRCCHHKAGCLCRTVADGALLLGMFAVAQYATEGRIPTTADLPKAAVILAGYVVCSMALRLMDADYEDALPRGAAVVIAAKFINGLS